MPANRISLAAITAFDPAGGRGGRERRSCCPFCGAGKPINDAHRSLAVNVDKGVFWCHRCEVRGRLDDVPLDDDFKRRRMQRNLAPVPRPALDPRESTPDLAESALRVRQRLRGSVPIAGSPAQEYLRRRGLAIGAEHDAKYHPAFFGRPAVLFAVRDERGAVVAVHGRMLDDRAPKAITIGPKRLGIYATSRAALRDSLALAVTEAPIDALSIAATGLHAIALLGCAFPTWLRRRVLGKTILLATDADEAGAKAADALRAALDPFGAECVRIDFGAAKDANGFLLAHGEEKLVAHILGCQRDEHEPGRSGIMQDYASQTGELCL